MWPQSALFSRLLWGVDGPAGQLVPGYTGTEQLTKAKSHWGGCKSVAVLLVVQHTSEETTQDVWTAILSCIFTFQSREEIEALDVLANFGNC